MDESNSASNTHVWAYGIKEPGWYIAKWNWTEAYAAHLRELGYAVVRSQQKPTIKPTEA